MNYFAASSKTVSMPTLDVPPTITTENRGSGKIMEILPGTSLLKKNHPPETSKYHLPFCLFKTV